METLVKIQSELKVPKGNFNSFGKYKYRSAEDILEALKPILLKHKAVLTITDKIEAIGNKMFLIATASINVDGVGTTVNGYAELSEHKGMSAEQCTGTASSYARKYALNGLFLIDETESDADSQNNKKEAENKITSTQVSIIEGLLKTANMEESKKQFVENNMLDCTSEEASKWIEKLKAMQVDPIESGNGYTQTDIKNKLKQIK